ncbi:hypothetical protein D6833_01620 [Candidatus Parcubacteria bacterium]|nr:MAG: hypothetical protein D6833_01620 [Candidatus Parcubacteria bacterium]
MFRKRALTLLWWGLLLAAVVLITWGNRGRAVNEPPPKTLTPDSPLSTSTPVALPSVAQYLERYQEENPVNRETSLPGGGVLQGLHIGGVSTGDQHTLTRGEYEIDVLDVYFRSRSGSVFVVPVAVGVETPDEGYFSLALDWLGPIDRKENRDRVGEAFPAGQGMAVVYAGEMTDSVFGLIWEHCSPVTVYGRLPNAYCAFGRRTEEKFRFDNMDFVQGTMEAAPDGWFLYGFFALPWEESVEVSP